MDEERGGWVELVRVREPARLGILRSVLEAAGIEHRVDGEQVQGLFPMAAPGFFLDRGMGAVILVRPEDVEDARGVIEERVAPLEVAPGEPTSEDAED